MSPTLIALSGIVVMLLALFLKLPVAFAMLIIGMTGAAILTDPGSALQLVASDIYRQFSSYTLGVVPLFILMGQVVFRTGMSTKLFDAAYRWIGSVPGGVAGTTILASMGFSAVSGSNSAATATVGAVALPEMKKYGYDRRLAGGSLAIGGTLGVLIPPSTALIIIAVQSEQSITTLFRASIFPGVLIGLMLLVAVLLICRRNPDLGPRGLTFSWGERLRALGGVLEILVIFVVSIFGMFLGWFTPTEAAAVGAFLAILLGVVTRRLTWERFWMAVIETLRISAMVVLLVASAVVFGRFLSLSRLPFELAAWVADLAVPATVILLVVLAIYVVGGAVMDALGFLVISIPIFFPLVEALDYEIVWFTIVVTIVTTLGSVTPPVGVNAFITAGLDKTLDAVTVFRGVMPFYLVYVLALLLFIAFPEAILFAVG